MYCVRADIESKRLRRDHILQLVDDELLGEYNDSDGSAPPIGNTLPLYSDDETLVNVRIAEAIEDADNEINLYLSARYTTPMPDGDVPAVINTISVDVAVYRLYLRTGNEMPDSVKEAYKTAIRLLEDFRSGKLKLPVQETTPDMKTTGAISVFSKARAFEEIESQW